MASETHTSGGVGFVGLLQLLFIALKLLGKIDWSWWWVLAPTWISASLLGIILLLCLVLYLWGRALK